MEVKLDLHIHSEHSPDGRMALDEIVACARARGLQGVAVCDHDRALTETWDVPDFLLIPGIELSTDRGHLLGLFVTEQIEARELDAAIDAVHACGGLAVMAHPFERSSDAQRLDAYLDRLDGIEVWNGRADRKNPQANAMAAVIQPLMTGGQTPWMLYFCGAALALVLTSIGVPALAFALGMFIPMELNAPLVVGGLVAWFVSGRSKDEGLNKARFDRGTLIASGFIAGGALMGVVSAVLKFVGVDWFLSGWASSNAAEWTGLAMYLVLIGYFAWHTLRAKKEE